MRNWLSKQNTKKKNNITFDIPKLLRCLDKVTLYEFTLENSLKKKNHFEGKKILFEKKKKFHFEGKTKLILK